MANIFTEQFAILTCFCFLARRVISRAILFGFQDTDIIVWDTVAEVGMCRLSGHKGPVTDLAFMTQYPVLISSGKDTFVKFWDLDTQHCFKTLVGHRTEVWALALVKNEQYFVTGCGDAELRVWKLSHRDEEGEKKLSVDQLAEELQAAALEDSDDHTVSILIY